MSKFLVESLRPQAEMNELEAHLVNVATSWASGKGVIKPVTLPGFLMVLNNEHKWFVKDHPGTSPVYMFITNVPGDRQEIFIQPTGHKEPTARIRTK
ncbi:hypothetical protein GCM10027347_17420 [Larkinella harenae]